jgi:nucleoside-diphosphate-sugar epimerase
MAFRPSSPFPAVITGAGGFVGRALLRELPQSSALALGTDGWGERITQADLAGATVFHLAARVHASGSEDEFERDNVDKTLALAQAAARAGARRFIYLSSVKVHGEETRDRVLRPGDLAAPEDAYARSKWAAECALRAVAARTSLAVVIVRAPLVVGAGARANLRALMNLADGPWPLPFAAVRNRRTLVQVDDLARLLARCATAGGIEGRVFFAGDPRSVSTPTLLATLRAAWRRPARLFAVPPHILEAGARLVGQEGRMRRLTRSLELDVSDTSRDLGWHPAQAIDDAIADMARAFRQEAHA